MNDNGEEKRLLDLTNKPEKREKNGPKRTGLTNFVKKKRVRKTQAFNVETLEGSLPQNKRKRVKNTSGI